MTTVRTLNRSMAVKSAGSVALSVESAVLSVETPHFLGILESADS